MPPRYVYWTILAGGLPTAFRAAEREELLPTFKRIKDKHPDAQMKYFARGKLWASPEEARQAADARRAAEPRRGGHRGALSRGPDWRPGGDHRDARQPFKDAKKARNIKRRKVRFEQRQRDAGGTAGPPRDKPHGDPLRRQTSRSFSRNRFDQKQGDRSPRAPQGRQESNRERPRHERRARPEQGRRRRS